jgi:signal transduction histidine kinase
MKRKRPKKLAHEHRLALTLLFTALVLFFMLVTLFVVGGALYLLIRLGFLTGPDNSSPSPAMVLLVFVPSALVFGAFATFLLGQIPMKRVNKLIDQMNRLAAGDYRARLTYDGAWARHPTAKELTDSFNRMAEELQSTELLRRDFIDNFSHEFKTPIVSIAGFAKLLRRGNLPQEQQEEYLSIIESESLRLAQMATNVLNLTKVENQTILTDVTAFNLSEQIRSCILLLSEKWESKGIEYELDFGEVTVRANQELLKQVWINLLGNAVKFSPQGGCIQVSIRQEEGEIAVSVTNGGREIPPEQQDKIFRKFYQADESHASEGNGIGLAIVRRVVELHEGTVAVESGGGKTTFTVTLPE